VLLGLELCIVPLNATDDKKVRACEDANRLLVVR